MLQNIAEYLISDTLPGSREGILAPAELLLEGITADRDNSRLSMLLCVRTQVSSWELWQTWLCAESCALQCTEKSHLSELCLNLQSKTPTEMIYLFYYGTRRVLLSPFYI